MTMEDPESRDGRSRDPWPAVALLTLAVVAWFGFQTVQLSRERGALQTVRAAQAPTIEQAQKLRGQLDAIAKKTLELAQQGNAGAALIVEELARRGVTINPSSPAGSTGSAPAPSK
jgi:hypothetical protein